jgi:serine protease
MSEGGAPMHIMFTRDMVQQFPSEPTGRVALSTSSNMLYNGGPVQPATKIYLVFWGSAWNSSSGDPDHMKAYVTNFLTAAEGSKWLATVTQYYQLSGSTKTFVGNSSITIGSWVDTGSAPPKHPSQGNLASEAQRGAAHFGNYTVDASYVVVSPHGIKPSGFGTSYCAWHSTTTANSHTIAYTNLPYMPDAGGTCGAGSVTSPGTLDGVSIVEGHEQAETETDPHLNAWYDSGGSEIGDKCAWIGLIKNSNAGGYPTQPLWSNASHSCVQSY